MKLADIVTLAVLTRNASVFALATLPLILLLIRGYAR
jgi:hypothetical protein